MTIGDVIGSEIANMAEVIANAGQAMILVGIGDQPVPNGMPAWPIFPIFAAPTGIEEKTNILPGENGANLAAWLQSGLLPEVTRGNGVYDATAPVTHPTESMVADDGNLDPIPVFNHDRKKGRRSRTVPVEDIDSTLPTDSNAVYELFYSAS